MSDPPIRATSLKRIDKGAVKATVDIEIRYWRLAFWGCLWFEKDGREWTSLPQRERTDKSGNRKFTPLVEFLDRETAGKFQGAALSAVHQLANGAK
jgi:hypothetical protein